MLFNHIQHHNHPLATMIDYNLYPHIVENIVSHLSREELIAVRLMCRALRDRADDELARYIVFKNDIRDEHYRRLPSLRALYGLASLPQPHILNNPRVYFACGKREQGQLAYAALTRIARAVRAIRLEIEPNSALMVPFERLMQGPVQILRLYNMYCQPHVGAPVPPTVTMAAQTVVLGLTSFRGISTDLFEGHPSAFDDTSAWPVDRADPLIRYSPSLKKVVYNCAGQEMLDIEQILTRAPEGRPGPLLVVYIFHPCQPEGLPRQRATLCDALLTVIRHTNVRLLLVNVEALPDSTFPFSSSDPDLRVAAEDRLPDTAERVGSIGGSVEVFVCAAQTASGRADVVDRVEILTLDEYHDKVGSWRFKIEVPAPDCGHGDTWSEAASSVSS